MSCTGTKLGGMIEGACHHGIDLAPTLFAAAVPSGVIDRAAHPGLVDDLVARLEQAMPLDGMSLVPHGAAVAEGIDDAGGWILARVRDVLPSTAPLIATFDCRANLSQAMVERADMLHRLEEDGAIPNGSIARAVTRALLDQSLTRYFSMTSMFGSKPRPGSSGTRI